MVMLSTTLRTTQNTRYGAVGYRRGYEAELGYSRPWRGLRVGAALAGGRDAYGADLITLKETE